jgi:cytosine/adenosine deaminase-related metal-dependent hydrolase
MSAKLFTAGLVATMDRRPIRDGAVLVDGGRIIVVDEAGRLRREHAAAQVVELGNVVLTPGLVNAHTHLELSDAVRPAYAGSFVDWLLGLIGSRQALGGDIFASAAAAAERGAAESLAFGVTCVGDITRFASATRPALARSPLRVVSFGEIQSMAGRRHLLGERLAEATDMSFEGWEGDTRLLTAVSPHAPYSVEPAAFAECLAWAERHRRPITTHLAETPDEAAFLAEHAGEFRRLWDALGDWRDDVPRFAGGPIRLAEDLGLLGRGMLLAHVNYVDDGELDLLAARAAGVVWCPRTHAYFGHPPHRFREMMERGMLVCLGTDSRASSPDLNVLEEARAVRALHPDLAVEVVWGMITREAARGLGLEGQVGVISPGAWGDFAAWPLVDGEAPLGAILDEGCAPVGVWVGGERVFG